MPALLENLAVPVFPGPLSKASTKKLDAYFDARAIHFVVDYEKSHGMQYVM
jgi:4-aminobutyrate aminotransferase/(S)-3-amino-2-methylpropionate transaminase